VLADLKEKSKAVSGEIGEQESLISSILSKYHNGFEVKNVECKATYLDGEVTFTDALTGEIVEQRAMTEEEQLQLSEGRIDAEDIIRQASKEED